ncbi:MAG: amidase [Gammaproteobacteria bacterium]|nr:amidase [Gammaproteobacteria bacterium]
MSMKRELHHLGVKEIAQGLRHQRFRCEDIVHAYLTRIENLEPTIKAWAWFKPSDALERARELDRRQAGGAAGALLGVPVGVKDIIDVQAVPTGMGSAAFADYRPEKSARVVSKLEAAGALILGKTVTAELAYLTPGKTRNPWNPAHTPGGSSSGSAAAVAAYCVPAAIGTQTNGSVIRPAAFCGVVGYKPSAGLISRIGILMFSYTLDQVGIFTHDVADAAKVAAAIIGLAPEDGDSVSDFVLPPDLNPAPLFQPPKLAAVRSPVWSLADVDQQENFTQCVASFRKAGAAVDPVVLPEIFNQAHDIHRRIMYYEGARAFSVLQTQYPDRLSAPINRLIDEGKTISESTYHAALENRTRLQGELNELLQRYDAIITPPARGQAPASLEHTGDPTFCTIWTLCGTPAITIPSGLGAQGLPLGLQVIGAYLQDARLLQAAQWCAQRIGFRQDPPE